LPAATGGVFACPIVFFGCTESRFNGRDCSAAEKFHKIFIQNPRQRCLCNETNTVNGDEQLEWFERFYKAKAAGLILYGRALGLGHGEAEDVVHETFLAVMRLPEFPREAENYFIRAYRNRALNYKRSLWRRVSRELESDRWFERSGEENAAAEEAAKALAELPLEQREVIVLKIWNGLTFEEIGGLMEISPNTAAGRYRYGLRKMKYRLKGNDHERGRNEVVGEPIVFAATAPGVGVA
jgi:RNA polymerase sigma-70 factor, ECF subfamily